MRRLCNRQVFIIFQSLLFSIHILHFLNYLKEQAISSVIDGENDISLNNFRWYKVEIHVKRKFVAKCKLDVSHIHVYQYVFSWIIHVIVQCRSGKYFPVLTI